MYYVTLLTEPRMLLTIKSVAKNQKSLQRELGDSSDPT
jgi:hypothetical protein